jgi:O-antigen/teichoic acid export membrane protein
MSLMWPWRAGTPLLRNAYALMASSALTAVLGMGYWILAARRYPAEEVGRASATIATMTWLSTIAVLNVPGSLTRYLPRAGRQAGRLVRSAYLLSGTLAGVASLLFLLGVGAWAPGFGFLRASPAMAAWFFAATVAWCIFTLQDCVLTGLRRAIWVPVENVAFGVAKMGLLLAFAAAAPGAGIFASWTIPMAAMLVPMNMLIFRVLLPRHARASLAGEARPIRYREIGVFLAGDSAGTMASFAATAFLPILVVSRFGPAVNAYFYVAWTTSVVLNLLAVNMGMSLTVEGSRDGPELGAHLRVSVQRLSRLLLPAVTVGVALAPLVLALFGASYVEAGTTLLRLLLFAAVPRAVVELYLGVVRAQGRSRPIALVQGAQAALFLVLVSGLLSRAGISGIGWAYALSNLVVAVPLLPRLAALVRGVPAPVGSQAAPGQAAGPVMTGSGGVRGRKPA